MLATLWPTYGVRITTPRLTLRLPDEPELTALAELAARGVHKPGERPFLTPWTEGSAEERARAVLRDHWQQLATWSPADWQLGLGVFVAERIPVGIMTVRARDFMVVRSVATTSWLGVEHQGRGLGTEARAGVLTLAFDHLGATDATSEVFPDNHASQAVSRKLGYVSDGITKDMRGDEALISNRLRLTAARWAQLHPRDVSVDGVEAARTMFAADPPRRGAAAERQP